MAKKEDSKKKNIVPIITKKVDGETVTTDSTMIVGVSCSDDSKEN